MRSPWLLAAVFLAVAGCTVEVQPDEGPDRREEAEPPDPDEVRAWVWQVGAYDGEELLLPLRSLILNLKHAPVLEAVVEGSRDASAKRRSNCAYVLGYAEDSEEAKAALLRMLDDPVKEVRYQVASSLGAFRVKAAIPMLIEGLYDDNAVIRTRCVQRLRRFTLQYFHYDPNDLKSKRDFFAAKWRSWWESKARTFRFPSA